jgi:thiol-disulfide isomerase/thioredoxin
MGHTLTPPIGKQLYLIGIVIVFTALLLGAVAFFGMNGAKEETGGFDALNATGGEAGTNLAAENSPGTNGSANQAGQNVQAAPENASAQSANNTQPSAAKEVTVDFLYADWCPHCQNMKPVVARIAAELPPDRFAVNYYSEADANAGKEAAAVFAKYGLRSYPTFVINGDDQRVGEMAESDFLAWACSKFSAPKPQACS